MRMRPLGRTGIQVSPYCLGTMMFGRIGNPDHDDCVRIIHRALDAGRYRKDRKAPERRMAWVPKHMTDERTHDTVELDVSYDPPAITRATLRRRSADERAAA